MFIDVSRRVAFAPDGDGLLLNTDSALLKYALNGTLLLTIPLGTATGSINDFSFSS